MPVHRIPRAHLDEDLKELRKTGEQIRAITYEGDTAVVFTDEAVETR